MSERPPGFLLHGGASPIGSSMDICRLALTQARKRGLRSHITNHAAALARTTDVTYLADTVSSLDPEDQAASVCWATERLAEGDSYRVVLGLRDQVVQAAADVAEAFGARGNSPDVVRRARNKDECRTALAAAGFRQPRLRLCDSVADATDFVRTSGGPCVVKPRDGMASIGVSRVDRADQVADAVHALPGSGPFLVEEFVSGPEFSAEGVFVRGTAVVLAVTAKQKFPPPYFVEAGHVLPADLPGHITAEIGELVRAALRTLGLTVGVFHVELWLTDRGVVLGEVHGRPGGDWLHLLLGQVIPGLELFGMVFDDVLGRPDVRDLTPRGGAAVRFLASPRGTLRAVRGWDAVLAHPAVLRAELSVAPGDVIGPVRESGDRAGMIAVGADTPAAAARLAGRLARSVGFVVA